MRGSKRRTLAVRVSGRTGGRIAGMKVFLDHEILLDCNSEAGHGSERRVSEVLFSDSRAAVKFTFPFPASVPGPIT